MLAWEEGRKERSPGKQARKHGDSCVVHSCLPACLPYFLLSVSLSASPTVYLSFPAASLFFSFIPSFLPCRPASLFLRQSVSMFCLLLSLSVHISLILMFFSSSLSVYLSLCLSLSLSVCQLAFVSAFLHVCLLCISVYLVCLSVCVCACQHACLQSKKDGEA